MLGVITKNWEAPVDCYLLSVIWVAGSQGCYGLTHKNFNFSEVVGCFSFFKDI